jgi:hypothetical protein
METKLKTNTDKGELIKEPVIVIEHLYKSFGTNVVLADFSLSV